MRSSALVRCWAVMKVVSGLFDVVAQRLSPVCWCMMVLYDCTIICFGSHHASFPQRPAAVTDNSTTAVGAVVIDHPKPLLESYAYNDCRMGNTHPDVCNHRGYHVVAPCCKACLTAANQPSMYVPNGYETHQLLYSLQLTCPEEVSAEVACAVNL